MYSKQTKKKHKYLFEIYQLNGGWFTFLTTIKKGRLSFENSCKPASQSLLGITLTDLLSVCLSGWVSSCVGKGLVFSSPLFQTKALIQPRNVAILSSSKDNVLWFYCYPNCGLRSVKEQPTFSWCYSWI